MINIILQPFGIGDCIFTQKLISEICVGNILWPVERQFTDGLQRAYPNILWVDLNVLNTNYQKIMKDVVIDDARIVPIRHANTIMKVPYTQCMSSKYKMYGLDWRIWKNTMYQRDMEREYKLYREVLGLEYGEKYNLINTRFRSNGSGVVKVEVNNSYRNIEMQNINGYSLFDWSYVIENATEIHTVGTSINYCIELLELKSEYVNVYKRLPDENHYQNYDYILEKHKYIYH